MQKVLKEAECQIVGMETAIQMCEAAAVGDLHTLKTFCENGSLHPKPYTLQPKPYTLHP